MMIGAPYIAAAIAAASFGAGWTVEHWRTGGVIARCEAARDGLALRIEEQNASIDAHKAISDKATTAAQDAAQKASEAQAKAQASDDARRAAIKAGSGPSTCSAAISAIRGKP